MGLAQNQHLLAEVLQVYASEHVPQGVFERAVDVRVPIDSVARSVVASLRGYVLGKQGERIELEKVVAVPRFPRYVPKWLRRRWTAYQTIHAWATPTVTWPEADIPAEWLGEPRRFFEVRG